jgi:hypothetical protein
MTLIDEYIIGETMIEGVPVTCTTYKIGGRYTCVIADPSLGTNVARCTGPTRESAVLCAEQLAKRLFTSA